MKAPASRRRVPALVVLALLPLLLGGLSGAATAGEVERVEKGNLVIEGIPEIPAEIAARLLQYQNTRSASLQGWLPDGQGIVISTRFAETSQLHVVRKAGGAREQITFFEEPVGGAALNPDPETKSLLLEKDVGGSEYYQIFHYDLATGAHRMLTDGKSRNGGALWSTRGDRFVFFTTRRNGRDWDLHVMDREGASKAVLEKGGVWFPADWSPDDSKLLVARYVSANESYPHILDLSTGEATLVEPTEEKVAYGAAAFSKDGKGVYYTSNQASEFLQLRYLNLATGVSEVLTEGIPWDVEGLALSEEGSRLAFTVNEDGMSTLHVWSTADRKSVDLPALPPAQIYGLEFSPDGKRLGMVLNSARTPGDVHSIDLESATLVRWTFSEIGGLSSDGFVEPTLIRYPTFDEIDGKPRMIPSFYYRPKGKGPFPVIIDIHGGPEGQERPYFYALGQYALNELGIALLAPNVRGSAGYGKSYLLLDNGFKREDSVKDIGALLDWVAEQPELDPERVAVYGGSYGGYMVLASMVRYSDRLRAGIDIVGISNFVTFLENTNEYRRDLRRVEYGDERDPEMREFLSRISPNNNASKITKPLFVIQGQNDPRVPVTESEQMVKVIREGEGTVWYLLAKDEGHGFRKKGNRDYMYNSIVLFLETFLLDRETATDGG